MFSDSLNLRPEIFAAGGVLTGPPKCVGVSLFCLNRKSSSTIIDDGSTCSPVIVSSLSHADASILQRDSLEEGAFSRKDVVQVLFSCISSSGCDSAQGELDLLYFGQPYTADTSSDFPTTEHTLPLRQAGVELRSLPPGQHLLGFLISNACMQSLPKVLQSLLNRSCILVVELAQVIYSGFYALSDTHKRRARLWILNM